MAHPSALVVIYPRHVVNHTLPLPHRHILITLQTRVQATSCRPMPPVGITGVAAVNPSSPLRQPRPRRRVTMPQGAGTVAVQVKAPTMVRREENGGGRQSLCQGAGCFWNHVNHPFLSPSLPLGVPRSLGNPTDQKGKDVNEGGRGGRTRLPLVGLGLFDVLLLVATVVGVYQGHLADFWRDHYTE